MASAFTAIGLAAAALDTVLIGSPTRSIQPAQGPILIPDVTIEERHKDTMEITRIPVEQGAPISDHAFKNPAELTMRIAWSDSTLTSAFSITDIYNQLLALQVATSSPPYLQPFTVTTGKRTYKNMLLRELQVVTDHDSENALMVEALFQEVLIVNTQVQSASTLQGVAQNQANPQNTAAPIATGPQQLGQSNTSAASTITGLGGAI